MKEFKIRLNAIDFTDLQDRLHRPITILNGVDFKRSVLENFIEAFKELVALNGTYDTDQVEYSIALIQIRFLKIFDNFLY